MAIGNGLLKLPWLVEVHWGPEQEVVYDHTI
jgi:hypothetical protein